MIVRRPFTIKEVLARIEARKADQYPPFTRGQKPWRYRHGHLIGHGSSLRKRKRPGSFALIGLWYVYGIHHFNERRANGLPLKLVSVPRDRRLPFRTSGFT